MYPWQRQVIQLQKSPAVLGQTLNYLAQQDSVISTMLIQIEGTVGTAAATPNPEGLPSLLSNIRVTGSLNVGGSITPINNVRGPQLAELNQFIRTNVSYSYGSLGATGPFACSVPCTFENPRLGGMLRYASCLPSNAMGSLSLSVQMSNQNQCDVDASPALVISTMNVSVQQNQFFVGTVPNDPKLYTFFYSTVEQLVNQNPQTGVVQQQLPNGAAFLNILMRSLRTTTAAARACITKQADGVNGPIDTSITSSGLTLLDANNVPKNQMDWQELRADNLDHVTDSLVPGNACFQFNRGASNIWRPVPNPSIVPLNVNYNVAGTTLPVVEFVYQRLFDGNNQLGLA